MATWGIVDDEGIAEASALIGSELPPWNPWITEVNRDAISHFAEGIGDDNPLWNDPSYATGSRWGTLLAPPTILYAVELPASGGAGLPGVQLMYGGTAWTWFDWVRPGDRLDAKTVFVDQVEKSGRFAKRWVLQTTLTTYTRHDGTVVAEAVGRTARTPATEQLAEQGPKKHEKRDPHRYRPDELARIEEAMLDEQQRVRGSEPRFWEDVQVGDPVGEVVRGPLTVSDLIACYAGLCGARPYGGAFARAIRYRRATGQYHISETTGAADAIGRGHLEPDAGDQVGMGGAYDIGPGRIAWGATLVTNWMGDDAFLHRLDARITSAHLVGDTAFWTGVVAEKSSTDGHHWVRVRLEAQNQLGRGIADGSAVVLLPRRAAPVELPGHSELVGD